MKDLFIKENGEQSIYIHVPFCVKKCSYCDFYSKIGSLWERKEYEKALLQEIELQRKNVALRPIRSIFFGGGTPSLLPGSFVKEVLEKLNQVGDIKKNVEITVEVNPESGTLDYLKEIKKAGVNRLSIGAQTFDPKILEILGRIHSPQDILNTVKNGYELGFRNINLDMMLGLPHQGKKELQRDIDYLLHLPITHISYYSLIVEEGTYLAECLKKGDVNYKLPGVKEDRDFYHAIVEQLHQAGFLQYEISNFAKPGYRCVHNMNYWKLGEYIGFGPAASSNIGTCRFKNVSSYDIWQRKIREGNLCIADEEVLTKKDRQNEWMMLALRLNEGINIKEFESIFKVDFFNEYQYALEKNIIAGTMKEVWGGYALTNYGKDVANKVELDFIK